MVSVLKPLLTSCFVFVACVGLGSVQRASDYYVYIGSYTNTTAKGIYVADFDSRSGTLSPPRLVAEAAYPAQLWVAPNERFLYAANWQGTDTTAGDTISAYAIDRATGTLSFINKVNGGGEWAQSGRRRPGRERRGGRELPERVRRRVWPGKRRKNQRRVLRRSARRPTAAAVKAAGTPRARGGVLRRQPLRVCRRHRPRSRVQLSPRYGEAGDETCRSAVRHPARGFGAAPAAALSERPVPVCQSGDRLTGQRVRHRRRPLERDPVDFDTPCGLRGKQHDRRDSARFRRPLPLRVESRPRRHRGVRRRPRRQAIARRACAVGRPHTTQFLDRSHWRVSFFIESGHRAGRRASN
ncbi:MAG: hypothetical protein EHM55_14065 [Acidobacteria bacterium]|nr:MAG: hypothetical protein EHM55_14065 [Acidobacteriota bacterium]